MKRCAICGQELEEGNAHGCINTHGQNGGDPALNFGWLTTEMRKARLHRDDIPGICASCGQQLFESLLMLDDAYGVWKGKCPHCGACNLLDTSKGIRGYHSQGMDLCLPYAEDLIVWGLPLSIPNRGWYKAENEGKDRDDLLNAEGGAS